MFNAGNTIKIFSFLQNAWNSMSMCVTDQVRDPSIILSAITEPCGYEHARKALSVCRGPRGFPEREACPGDEVGWSHFGNEETGSGEIKTWQRPQRYEGIDLTLTLHVVKSYFFIFAIWIIETLLLFNKSLLYFRIPSFRPQPSWLKSHFDKFLFSLACKWKHVAWLTMIYSNFSVHWLF